MKPFAESAEQNKHPILAQLQVLFTDSRTVLEIGSGTGQHAVFFAANLPQVSWLCSDQAEQLAGIRLWVDEANLPNIGGIHELDVCQLDWPVQSVGGVYSANTVHIMSWPEVEAMFAGIGRVLQVGGLFCLYGPFNYAGSYSSESNARFDQWLKQRDPHSGIRDLDDLTRLGEKHGLVLQQDNEMPVNNRLLVWRKL